MSDHIPREFIEHLLAKIDLVDLINLQIPLRKKSGANYFARCPFHQEKSASFSVSQPKQFYYCFGCGAHGNAIDFLMQYERLTFPETIESLARQAGMEVPHTSITSKQNTAPLYDLLQLIADFYYAEMRQSKRAIDYLKQRGISGAIARQFSIGYAPNQWSTLQHFAQKNNVNPNLLHEAGLSIKRNEGGYYDRFRDRILFPIRDVRGRIIGFGGRIIDQGEPKYLNSPETNLFQKGHELYGLYEALKTNRNLTRILIVEGYMDVIALHQHGINYATATMGTATTSHHIQRLFRYTAEIVFCFDGDEAGKRAAWRALETILPMIHDSLQVRFLFLPDGEDPDTLIRKQGKIEFDKRIESAHSLSNFFFQAMSKQADIGTLEGRARFANIALDYIKTLTAPLFQEIMLDELSKRARINLSELKQRLNPTAGKTPLPATPNLSETKVKISAPLRLVMALIVQHPSLVKVLPESLPLLEMMGYPFLLNLIENVRHHPHITTGGLLEYWRGEKEGSWVAKLAQWQHMIPEEGLEKALTQAWNQLLLLGIDEKINKLMIKATFEPLTEEEKIELTQWIAKKKA